MEVPSATNKAISVESLSLSFRTQDGPLSVLGSISFSLTPGEVVSLIGPSGCGKTTLLRVLSGLYPIDGTAMKLEGRAAVFDHSPAEASNLGAIGFVPQSPSLVPWRTASENVRLPLEIGAHSSAKDPNEVVQDKLGLVGLSSFSSKLPIQLSGGMQSRVAIARALVRDPEILLLDEPFGSLDTVTRRQLQLELGILFVSLHTTVVMVTHALEEAVFLSDRIILLSGRPSRIVQIFNVQDSRPRTLDYFSTEQLLSTVSVLSHSITDASSN